ncbi:MAG: N-acetylmuramoyl-L-alanine amidase [Gammaproteobacteria bacterium]|jgi:N-acetyl-anhydromuramyl-L-alanine amidase AmpD|nr:N-acetylmuramoyl-L-alanine amidase [Gammaproteobacteria bacterium]MBU1506294.1 N-acetylmuramoyl-L-alanine amidase [Gammaproteobacteria bacterium]MBU2123427.1 N-acetylmuramoyl-L-alanine amidase [Gammaproteobacteria bacterium]MBU2169310.1 N-acetylmuramoyl-L-alanine amidase [Gammaproteobacteria bacterium]MBU2201461.1 N-acetylmuramoyl-L-alanine amidase [Gammaproteobacteria bacterium]
MLQIDEQGMLVSAHVRPRRFSQIERQPLSEVKGIVVHQTGAERALSSFNSYGNANANGAHFLIDKDGVIYQTASVFKRTNHVGSLQARCLAEYTCKPAEFKKSNSFPQTGAVDRMHAIEMLKSVPARYPSNVDSIGIEIVGKPSLPPGKTPPAGATPKQKEVYFNNNAVYESVNAAQNVSLRWLVSELIQALKISKDEVFRHPVVSRKNPTEASTASW